MTERTVTVPELGLFLTEQILKFAEDSTKTVLEGNQNKLKRFISRFSKDPEAEQQRLKLHFNLFIAYLAVLVVDLQLSENFLPYTKPIVDEIVALFYGALKRNGGAVVFGDDFIKDEQERLIISSELRKVDPKVFGNLSGLPRLGLTAIADFLLEKRLNQYREMWLDDMKRIAQDSFVPLMPTKVFQHWTGGNPRGFESLSFSLLLFNGLMGFSTANSHVLGMMKLKS